MRKTSKGPKSTECNPKRQPPNIQVAGHQQSSTAVKRTRKPVPTTLPPDGEGFVREPTVRAVFSISHTTLWRFIKEKRFPAPFRLGVQSVAWDVAELRKHMEHIRQQGRAIPVLQPPQRKARATQ